jgi:hypothetical protein
MFDPGNLHWTRGKLAIYPSSREVERGFCARCGSTLTFARPARKEISVLAGSLDDPNLIEPQMHIFTDHRVAWLHNADRLPRYKRFPPGDENREPD